MSSGSSSTSRIISINVDGTTEHHLRCSEAQLRRAAGSQSLERLQEAVRGWEVSELNDMNGKNPIHMAAWKGCIENLQFLLEELHCDVNSISTGEYSYGKTAIFFALTQSRQDVVEYLLNDIEQESKVKIVNNKGQTPLSIASSHLPASTIRMIQNKVKTQENAEWVNYRRTHSDGLEYGDLDPRFLDRPLRHTDNVTAFAVNPTTKEIRKGNFLRNNPHRTKEANNKKQQLQPSKKEKNGRSSQRQEPPALSEVELQTLEEAWRQLETLKQGEGNKSSYYATILTTIIQLNVKRRRTWIPQTAERLDTMMEGEQQAVEMLQRAMSFVAEEGVRHRELALMQRLVNQLQDPTGYRISSSRQLPDYKPQSSSDILAELFFSNERWPQACQYVLDYQMATLEHDQSPTLSLPTSPYWVDTMAGLQQLEAVVAAVDLVSIDTEWHGREGVSTLQIAVKDRSWVVDLLRSDDHDYQLKCRALISSLFRDKLVLGFAIGHDVSKLETFVHGTLPLDTCLDLQELWTGPQMPGLAKCAAEYSTRKLDKTQQCSDWSQRPLTPSQLEYAGLDAVILPYLLAEKYRTFQGQTKY